MAKKNNVKKAIKAKTKKVVKNVLDKTELDEKVVAKYNEAKESSLLDKIEKYARQYGGTALAVGAGCTFGVNNIVTLILLSASVAWVRFKMCCNCKNCDCAVGCCK